MATRAISIDDAKTGETTEAVYEHPFLVRLCHWVNAVALFVMVGSGLQIFRAFPSFGAKIPQKDLLNWPKSLAIGGFRYTSADRCLAVKVAEVFVAQLPTRSASGL